MPDGIVIQDRDLFSVPSTRRNSLLADVFERLGYMERKGSGFGKIMSAYEFQVNYTEDKKSIFRSDRSNFFAIMPNLNFGTQGGTQDGTQGDARDKLEDRLIQMIKVDEKISIKKMSEATGVSVRTIKRRISEMPDVQFIGRGFSGHWEIKDDRLQIIQRIFDK